MPKLKSGLSDVKPKPTVKFIVVSGDTRTPKPKFNMPDVWLAVLRSKPSPVVVSTYTKRVPPVTLCWNDMVVVMLYDMAYEKPAPQLNV